MMFTVGRDATGGGRAGGRKTITTRNSANSAVETDEERAEGAGLMEGEGRPLFLGNRIVVGWVRGDKVDGRGQHTGWSLKSRCDFLKQKQKLTSTWIFCLVILVPMI
jgi:hypothetical protein